jgi:hypothetical protein
MRPEELPPRVAPAGAAVDLRRQAEELSRESAMATRKELIREYKETPKSAGVFAITNTANGKAYLGSSLNLHGPLNKHRFMLSTGAHDVRELQEDWNRFGPGSFTFEILEVVEVKDSADFSLEDELRLLEEIWLERLEPFGDRGYNPSRKIREA